MLQYWLGEIPSNPQPFFYNFYFIMTARVDYHINCTYLCHHLWVWRHQLTKVYTYFLGDIDNFKEFSFCNFEYLLSMMHMTSVQSLINNLQMTFSHVLDAEIYLVLR